MNRPTEEQVSAMYAAEEEASKLDDAPDYGLILECLASSGWRLVWTTDTPDAADSADYLVEYLARLKKQVADEYVRRLAAEKVVHGLQGIWDDLKGCAHAWDAECARCRWLRPLADALQDFERAHNDASPEPDSSRQIGRTGES